MAAEMTRLPTFNDLKIGALAENGRREDTKEKGNMRFYSILVEGDGCNIEEKETSCYFEEEVKGFTKRRA